MTIVSIIRLICVRSLLEGIYDMAEAFDTGNFFIWTSMEINVSIICGQYMIVFSVRFHIEGRWLTLRPSLSS